MSEFIQCHLLTSYPPSNLNRDDLGRPKTAVFGGTQRQRASSQSLKRSWRQSEGFQTEFAGQLGTRTRLIGEKVLARCREKGVSEKEARLFVKRVAGRFGTLPTSPKDDNDEIQLRQLAHFSAEELRRIEVLADKFAAGGKVEDKEIEDLLTDGKGSIDIALFGRMLADDPANNIDAAVQVAHAITVHRVAIEDDYFTAVDDLNRREDNAGAGHVNVGEFSAGLFYLYFCVNRSLLRENLGGDEALTSRAVKELVRASVTTGPKGKANSFGSHAYASYVLAERGSQQPRNLSVAFLRDVSGNDFLAGAINALRETRDSFERAYGKNAREKYVLDVEGNEGTLEGLLDFVGKES